MSIAHKESKREGVLDASILLFCGTDCTNEMPTTSFNSPENLNCVQMFSILIFNGSWSKILILNEKQFSEMMQYHFPNCTIFYIVVKMRCFRFNINYLILAIKKEHTKNKMTIIGHFHLLENSSHWKNK